MKNKRMPSLKRLTRAYNKLGNVHKIAAETGVSHSYVYIQLAKAGVVRPINKFDEGEKKRLQQDYLSYRDRGELDVLADEMGRTKSFICRKARELGLTDRRHKKYYAGKWKYMTDAAAQKLWDEFKASPYTLGRWCNIKGISELSFWQAMSARFPDEWEHVIETKTPKETMYRRGRRFEYRVRDDLKSLGLIVTRSPASRSPVDLIAIGDGVLLFIQCKTGGCLPPKEWNEIYNLSSGVNAIPILAQRQGVKGIAYYKLTGKKDGSRRRQPYKIFDPKKEVSSDVVL